MARDDFLEAVKRALGARVGNRCSNPDCRALTSGPQDDASKALNIGVAAHIAAAAPGGARYDPLMSSDARAAAENGIWLCQNCAKLVDNDPAQFPSGVLHAWKVVAEHHARYQIGKTTGAADRQIEDKFVDYKYPEEIGLAEILRAEGYHMEWVHSHREPLLVETQGFERVVQTEAVGRRCYLKTREPDCEYMIYLRKRA